MFNFRPSSFVPQRPWWIHLYPKDPGEFICTPKTLVNSFVPQRPWRIHLYPKDPGEFICTPKTLVNSFVPQRHWWIHLYKTESPFYKECFTPNTVTYPLSWLSTSTSLSYLQGWTDAIGGPGRLGWASMVTVFFAWSWLKSSYICSTVNGFLF